MPLPFLRHRVIMKKSVFQVSGENASAGQKKNAFYFIFNDIGIIFICIAAVYLLDTFSARLALWFRRMHDTGIKGTFSLVVLIPLLGALALLFVFMSDSQPKNNVYGEYIAEEPKKKKAKKKK